MQLEPNVKRLSDIQPHSLSSPHIELTRIDAPFTIDHVYRDHSQSCEMASLLLHSKSTLMTFLCVLFHIEASYILEQ